MKRSLISCGLYLFFQCTILFGQSYGSWVAIDSLNEARYSHTAIQLIDGRVLVVGGIGSNDPKSCEIYDTVTNKWSFVAKTIYERWRHKVIMLDSKRILAVSSPVTKTCEIYDPIQNIWTLTDSLKAGRVLAEHELIKLKDGRVLVIGGLTRDYSEIEKGTLRLCELYDENLDKWEVVDSMIERRQSHSAILLKDGRVLVSGGISFLDPLATYEIYDPAINKWESTTPMNIARESHKSILLPDGKVLVVGGYSNNNLFPTRSCEIYDPNLNRWQLVDSTQVVGSAGEVFILDERNLILIGANSTQNLIWEIYDYIDFKSKFVGYYFTGSFSTTKIQLKDGRILISGGVTTPDNFQYLPVKKCFIFDLNTSVVNEEIRNTAYPKIKVQNYPNPFNYSTKIRFFLEKPSWVKIEIINLLGEIIEQIIDSEQNAGHQEYIFSAEGLSSGIYFSRVIIENQIEIKKLLLLK
ncbi:MAG: T9SS type A sorting domain-containing protein [Melioribacter sp.]|nr:T9SS type A sorting domain-containing protein [Melioribacter sp.]